MTKPNNILSFFLLTILTIGLCGCPPLKHDIFIRNTTLDTTNFTLTYKSGKLISKKYIEVKSKNELLKINNKTLSDLNQTLTAFADSNKINLKIPPKSTVFVSNILDSFGMFDNKTLVVKSAANVDTITFNYPYRRLHDFKYKRNKLTNFFYRTIIYYDIK